jgi:hypothetical protein
MGREQQRRFDPKLFKMTYSQYLTGKVAVTNIELIKPLKWNFAIHIFLSQTPRQPELNLKNNVIT